MKIYLLIASLLFSKLVFANDISDFQIEGMSIGDSALDYFEKNEIINNKLNYYKNKTYTPVNIQDSLFETYDSVSFNYKTNDNKFIIQSISGIINFNNDMRACLKLKKNILEEIKYLFVSQEFQFDEGNLDADPLGKYSMDGTFFDNDDSLNITCYDYSDNSGYNDALMVSFSTKEYNDFLAYAYY